MTKLGRLLSSALMVALPLAASGCIAQVGFDPVGTAASMDGAWLVSGAAPTSEACDALGVSYVRVRFYDATRTADHPDLVFACAQGSFDTRPDRVVADGRWTVALIAIDAEGNAIATGPQELVVTSEARGHVTLAPVDFAL